MKRQSFTPDFIEALLRDGAADLHMHSRHSDGSEDVPALLNQVVKAGLKSFSLSDHDSVEGLAEMESELERRRQKGLFTPFFIPGIELSLDDEGQEVHLLGYFQNADDAGALRPFLAEQQLRRAERNLRLVERLNQLGFPVRAEELAAMARGNPSRVHVALWLKKEAHVASVEEAFDRWLLPGRAAYVERDKLSLKEGIRHIHRAGGLAFLAHPAQYGFCDVGRLPFVSPLLITKLAEAKDWGLDGVEAFHGDSSPAQREMVAAAARYLNLARSAGSDWHGNHKDHARLYRADSAFLDHEELMVEAALMERQGDSASRSQGERRYWLGRRAPGQALAGFWEIPGGKRRQGEASGAALRRELNEELGCSVEAATLHSLLVFPPAEGNMAEKRRLILACFHSVIREEEAQAFQLRAHDRGQWMSPQEALAQKILPADAALFKALIAEDAAFGGKLEEN